MTGDTTTTRTRMVMERLYRPVGNIKENPFTTAMARDFMGDGKYQLNTAAVLLRTGYTMEELRYFAISLTTKDLVN